MGGGRRRRDDLRRRLVRGASSGGGLGFFIWNSYVGGSYPQIIVGMISIGIAGYLSSAALRLVAGRLSRWNAPHGGRA